MRIDPPDGCPEVEELKTKLTDLAEKLKVGDVTPKRYAKARQDLLARLGRAKIAPRLESDEAIVAEHHWLDGHARIPDSVLKETAQIAQSLYATDRRLFRWRFQDQSVPGAALLEGVEERLEDLWYREVVAMERRSRRRWGEALTGVAIAAIALLLQGHLRMTAFFLAGLGVFALLHALLFPTRWVALTRTGGEPWDICAVRARSGRELLAEVERRTRFGGG